MRSYIENKIVEKVNALSLDPECFREYFKNPYKDFTRVRKQSFSDIVKIGMLSSGSCMKEGLREYHGIGPDRPSASAYIQQRDKLTPECYRMLFNHFLDFGHEFSMVKGKYLLVACDGSDVNIHPSDKDEATMLKLSNNPNGKVCNQVHLNAFSIVPDGYFIDYIIQDKADTDECFACAHMMRRLASRGLEQKMIITCDRAYEAYSIMMLASSLGLFFCIRAKDINSRGISCRYRHLVDEDGSIDQMITRKYSRCIAVQRNKDLYPDYIYVPHNSNNTFVPDTANPVGRNKSPIDVPYYEYSFRLVRFDLGNGNHEVLLTNLPQEEFDADDLKELYHLRWSIETAFRFLKYDDYVSFSNTRKKTAAIGEIVLSMIFHNICVSILIAFNARCMRKISARKLRYRASYSDLSKSIRLYIAGRDPTISARKIVKELHKTIQPVRNERTFPRILRKRSFVPFVYRAA